MLYKAKNHVLDMGDTYMDYVTFGNGTEPMVIIPGLSLQGVKGSAIPMAHMFRQFSKDYKVYIFDKKARLPEPCSIGGLTEDLAEAMMRLGIQDACVLGVSQGGMMGLQLAADYPELVKKLVPAVTLSRPNDTVKNAIGAWTAMAREKQLKILVEDVLEKMYSEEYLKKYRMLIPALSKTIASVDLNRFINLAESCTVFNIHNDLDRIKCPVLVIGAAQDKIATGKASEDLADRLGCELYMYENLGHAAYEEAKDFNQRVYNFFRK